MMIQLDELTVWSKLSSPYGNSKEIPPLVLELSKTHKREIANEIIWDYIYHQGSTYENTLVTVPHLLKIINKTENIDFKIDLMLSLGIVLIGFDKSTNIEDIFQVDNLNEEVKNRIRTTFFNSIEEFKTIVHNSFSTIERFDEDSKRYFLIAYLVTITKHKEAEMFKTFSENDEYIFVCPNCNEESFLWNEENILNAYKKDPVSNKDQKKTPIHLNESNQNLAWLENLINRININSLKPLIPYFKGNMNCHNCEKNNNIFDGIMNSF